jgi:two-component system, chemotaxis family, CheB/CheR fusion protein
VPEFKIAGIGASAGGLTALKALFDRLTPEPGMSFVVVVHLAPDQKSHLAELLQPHAPMPVQQVTETTKLEPNHIYVIPPNFNLDAVDTHLRLSSLETRRFDRAPIDHFFRTLADSNEGNAIGVVLSGSGRDGTLGLRRIKERGGVTIVQEPAEAEYDGMPRSAIGAGVVDLVLPVSEIAARVVGIARSSPDVPPADVDIESTLDENRLIARVFAQIRARTGHDFSEYKRSTIMRRIGRRMQVNQIGSLSDYVVTLRDNRREIAALFDDLLITVTEFFRDPEVFEQLAKDVVPRLFERRQPYEAIRIWSAGCATGEEAYSLAMLMLEEAARREVRPNIQIFATDLHSRSLKTARDGEYPESISSDVSPERLRRFFQLENGAFRIRQEVRELVLFAAHDLLKDPPFSHLDLIVCRNLMIYLQRDVQSDVISLFHYALDPDGLVLLGTAETMDGTDLFQAEHKPICLYRRRSVPTRDHRLPVFTSTMRKDPEHHRVPERGGPSASFGGIHARLVEQYAPPSILVNENHDVVHYSAHAGRYLEIPGGEPTSNVFKLVGEPLRFELRAALQVARERGATVRSKPIALTRNGIVSRVVIRVRPSPDDERNGFYLVFFDDVDDQDTTQGDGEPVTGVQREL